MKKLLTALAAAAALTSAAAHAGEISVAATAVPHAELLEFVKPALAKEGVELKIKVFTDYVQPNVQVAEGRLDANFFQHQPYLDEFNASRGTALVSIAGVRVPSWTIAVPSRIRLVACARTPSGVSASCAQNSGNHTDVAPSRSASTT